MLFFGFGVLTISFVNTSEYKALNYANNAYKKLEQLYDLAGREDTTEKLQAKLNEFTNLQRAAERISLSGNVSKRTKAIIDNNTYTAKNLLTGIGSPQFNKVMGASTDNENQILTWIKKVFNISPKKVSDTSEYASKTNDLKSFIANLTKSDTETNPRLIVKYKTQLKNTGGNKIVRSISKRAKTKTEIVEVKPEDKAVVLQQLAANPDIAYAEEDFPVTPSEVYNDPYFTNQWAFAKTQVIAAWDTFHTPESIDVAILDTGIDESHADLSGRIISRANFSDYPDGDVYGHGTHVAGIVSATVNNQKGVAGVSYEARLMSVKVLGDNGPGWWSDVAEGIRWSADNGAEIINMSLGNNYDVLYVKEAVEYATSKGVVVVAAAGNNSNSSLFYPAAYPAVVSVAATDENDQKATFSNFGSWVTMAAPGVSIISTYKGGYSYLSGTSMASPFVAGVAALIRGQHPEWTSGQVVTKLSQAIDAIPNTGNYWKYGRINACKAVDCINTLPTNTPGPTEFLIPSSALTPTPVPTIRPTPTTSPTPTSRASATATPTTAAVNCGTNQAVTLGSYANTVSPGGNVVNTLYIKSNDSASCSSTYTISYGKPTAWTISTIPASFSLSGGKTKSVPFTISLPASASAGTNAYQFWVAKAGQSSVDPINGYVTVSGTAPTSTPIPTSVPCISGFTASLGSNSLSGNAGATVNQSLYLKNNNPAGCGSAVFAISYAVPSGYAVSGLPPSKSLTGGQETTINYTITISTGASISDQTHQVWINSGSQPMNTTIHVTGTTTPPETQMFGNLSARMYGDYALFKFSYNANGTGSFRVDTSTQAQELDKTSNPAANTRFGFAFSSGTPMDPSNNATPDSIRAAIQRTPQGWPSWTCGTTIYWRMYDSSDLRVKSPIQSGTVDCSTQIDILPWEPWYDAIYRNVYDSRYDTNNDNSVNWTDYWVLVDQTRLR